MGYYRIIHDMEPESGMGFRGSEAEEAFMAGYRKGYGEAMMRVSRQGEMSMGFRQGESGMNERTQPYFPPRGMGFRDDRDPYYEDMDGMGERRRRSSNGRYM